MKSLRQLTSLSLFSLCATFALTTTVAYAGPPPPPPAGGAPPPPAEGTPGAPPPPSGGNAAVPPSASPLNSAPPTGKLKSAEDQYKGNKFDQAAMAFAEAAGQQIPGDTPRAQFWLGKSLYKLGFFASSLSVFGEIVAAGPTHPYHKLTLPWLASLSRELPEGAGVLEKVGSYKPESL
ncbi:MAG: tetratricopeptide repeat protein, partial [Nannocystaceae bacterium]